MKVLFFFGICAAMSGAAANAANCDAISAAIDLDLKYAAQAEALSRAQRAADADTHLARFNAALVQAQTNLSLLIAAKCPLPEYPVTWRRYAKPAGQCGIQEQRARLSGEPPPESENRCDVSRWTAAEEGPTK